MALLKRVLVLAALTCACAPAIDDDPSLVTGPRVLAWRATPPEAGPGATVHLEALVAGPTGMLGGDGLTWSLCTTPRPLGDNGAVAPACTGTLLPVVARGAEADLVLPANACTIFGPEPSPAAPGQPAPRPADPDATGGYYQPVRIDLGAAETFGLERLSCAPAGVSMDTARAFAQSYQPNRNPSLAPLAFVIAGARVPAGPVAASATVTLVAGWTADSAEPYPVVDLSTDSLLPRRESLRVSWFISAGRLDAGVTSRSEGDPATSVENEWTAPAATGAVHLWLVLGDSRGGSDFAAYDIDVVP